MPATTLLEIPPEEQAQMRAILRRARYGYLLAFHILLLCAAGRNPTEIATFLFCSRSSVYRIVRAYRAGSLGVQIDADGQLSIAVQTSVLMPWLTRSLGALLKAAPRAYGWCRTRWSCATLAATLQAKHGIAVSAETVRRWLHEIGWVWKQAKLVARDDDPHRIERLARIRFHHEHLQPHEMMVFADELDMHLLPKVGAAWMPQGTQAEIMTPGKNEKHYLAGALHLATGKVLYGLGPRKPTVSPLLTPVTSRNILLLQSLPTNTPFWQVNSRRRKDDTRVGTEARGIVERLSRLPRRLPSDGGSSG